MIHRGWSCNLLVWWRLALEFVRLQYKKIASCDNRWLSTVNTSLVVVISHYSLTKSSMRYYNCHSVDDADAMPLSDSASSDSFFDARDEFTSSGSE